MLLDGKWWPLENVRTDECTGCERAVVCFRWCYRLWGGQRLGALSVNVLEKQSLEAPL